MALCTWQGRALAAWLLSAVPGESAGQGHTIAWLCGAPGWDICAGRPGQLRGWSLGSAGGCNALHEHQESWLFLSWSEAAMVRTGI